MIKKSLSALMLATLAISLVGCGGKKEATTTTETIVTEATEAVKKTEAKTEEPELPSEEEKIGKEYTLDTMLTDFSGGIAWARVQDDSGKIMEVLLNQDLQIVYEKPDDMEISMGIRNPYGGKAILRYYNGEENSLIVLDANGEKVFEVTGFEGEPSLTSDGSLVYMTRESDISADKQYLNVINANYEQVCKIETDNIRDDDRWYYVADGVYASYSNLLNVNQNTCFDCPSFFDSIVCDGDGCVLLVVDDFYMNADLIDWNSITSDDALANVVKTNGQEFYSKHYIGNHTVYSKDTLLEGRNFPDYILKTEDLGCAFSENGNMALTVRGADGKDYVVVCDSNGNPLYEPVEVNLSLSGPTAILFCQNYIILPDGTVVTPDGSKCQLGDGTALSGLDKKCVARLYVDEIYGATMSEVSLSNGYITCHSILYSIDGTQITTVTKAE